MGQDNPGLHLKVSPKEIALRTRIQKKS